MPVSSCTRHQARVFVVLLCREIDGWAQSAQYQQLLQRNQRSNGHNGNGAELSSNGTQLSTSEIRIPVTD